MFSGLISQVRVLKAEVSNVELEPFAPQREVPGFEISPGCRSLCQGRVYAEIAF